MSIPTAAQEVAEDLALYTDCVNVVGGTLKRYNASPVDVVWGSLYVWPDLKMHGTMNSEGNPTRTVSMTVWRNGETVSPRAGDQFVVSGQTYNIVQVGQTRIGSGNYSVFECVTELLP